MTDSARSRRVKWLRDHPIVLTLSRPEIIREMRRARVLSEKTYEWDVNLYNLMRDAGYGRRQSAKFSLMPGAHGCEPKR